MQEHVHDIRNLLDAVRSRLRRLAYLEGSVRAALALGAIGVAVFVAAPWVSRAPAALVGLGVLAVASATGVVWWAYRSLGAPPSDRAIARFVEERDPWLDDALVSAVSLLESEEAARTPLAPAMLASTARTIARLDPSRLVAAERLRRAGVRAAAAALVVLAVAVANLRVARQIVDATRLLAFPSRVSLQVTPGTVRLQADAPLTIEARLVGVSVAPGAQLLRAEGDAWRSVEMTPTGSGSFAVRVDAVPSSFAYRVAAGGITSPTYQVTVARAPRVTRIDIDYTYPPGFGMPPRTEEDSGDVYAPPGTEARIRVHTDAAVARGRMTFADGHALALEGEGTAFAATLQVTADTSYRVALADREGLESRGDTEYFVRVLEDRAPDVHIVKPASDRSVTALEEVDVEVQADDDHGLDRLELVYGVRGAAPKVAPLQIPPRATSATGRYTLYVEDLGVRPGDVVTYFARARDVARGKRSSEARSDLFFLEIKPFERAYTLAKNEGGSGGSSLDDLVTAQKNIIAATWKLDRRTEVAGARSDQDLRSVGRAEAELKERVESMAGGIRGSMMRDPRRSGRGAGQPAGQTLPEEDAMSTAAAAMGKAVSELDALKTPTALPFELEALDALVKAQGDARKREISNQQQSGSAQAANRTNVDTSALFDRELQRQQQTNYEAPKAAGPNAGAGETMLDKIRDLAKRQDELTRQQQDLGVSKDRLSAEELKRALETLTREQSDLRQRAEDLTREMAASDAAPQDNAQKPPASGGGQRGGAGQTAASGSQPSGQAGGSGGQPESAQKPGGGQARQQQMREVTEQMRGAASGLRRQDPAGASQRGAKALDTLQTLADELQRSGPDDGRRRLGDAQLEARQLADAERRAAAELNQAVTGAAGADMLRRLAAEQERLAERAEEMRQALKQAASAPAQKGGDDSRQAAADAARDADRESVAQRMRDAAVALRAAAGDSASGRGDGARDRNRTAAAVAEQDVAKTLEKMAETLTPAGAPRDEAGRQLADRRTRARELRERIENLADAAAKAGAPSASEGGRGGPQSAGQGGRQGRGQAGGGEGGTDLAQLREQYMQQLKQTEDLLSELQRDDPAFTQGGAGFTFDGRGMTLSAPGTEAFKQDFGRWEQLRQQATQALQRAEGVLSKKLREQQAQDRIAAGADDAPPAGYQADVDRYFKALAGRKP